MSEWIETFHHESSCPFRARAEKAERERDEARAGEAFGRDVAAKLAARAEQAEREAQSERDDARAAARLCGEVERELHALRSRVLTLAEGWKASQAEDRVQRWTFQICGQKLREALEGGGK